MEEKIYAMWLSDALGPGNSAGKILIEKYGSFTEIHKLKETDYAQAGVKPGSSIMQRLMDKNTAKSEKDFGFCNYNYFDVIEYTAQSYPKRLKSIMNPPTVLYTRGRMIDIDDNVCIGIVGTRSYTDIGWNSVYRVAGGIAKSGAVVVTGLASGIDTAATRAALEGSGYAIGIIGGGIERIYPSENKELFETMYRCGLVISELSPFSNITGTYFPIRNRIISGLCQGVLVGEGNIKSGAMITAKHAAEQGRHIFAIPGDINSEESSGVNKLIKEGAIPVFESSDVLEKYRYLYPHRIKNIKNADNLQASEVRSSKKVRLFSKTPQKTAGTKETKNTVSGAYIPRENIPQTPENQTKASEKQIRQLPDYLCETEKKVYSVLSDVTDKNTDTISVEAGISTDKVLSALTTLEIEGLIVKTGTGVLKI